MDVLLFLFYLYLSACLIQAISFLANIGKSSTKRLPPGPWPLPVVGNLFHIGNSPNKSFAALAKTYGPIMTLQLGRVTTVVISSAKMAREVLHTNDLVFSNRTIPESVTPFDHDRLSVVWAPVSPLWKSLRRALSLNLSNIRKLNSTVQLRRQKLDKVLSLVRKKAHDRDPIEIGEVGSRTSINYFSDVLFSEDLADPFSEDGGSQFEDAITNLMTEIVKPNLVDYFPVLKRIDPNGRKRQLTVYFGHMLDLIDCHINKRLQLRGKSADLIRKVDALDTLLDIVEDDNEQIGIDHIRLLLLDVFGAGTDTTSATLEWAMAELLRNPDKLSSAKAELEQVVGRGNPIEECDFPRLPYIQAVVNETFRLHPAVPLLLPHKAEAETVVCGFTIPKDTQVIVNVWAIGRDSNSWEDPEAFVPERFLGEKL